MMLAGLAWRNVLRDRRRSAITVLSVALGLAALTFVWAFIDGMNQQMIVNSTRMWAGDMQLHLRGYHDDPTPELTMADAAAALAAARADPNVAAATVRLEARALASARDKSRGILLVGVVPDAERDVSTLLASLVSGDAPGGEDSAALIGEQLGRALGLAAGGELVLVGQAFDGSLASARLRVSGVFRTGIDEVDGYVAVLPIAGLRELLVAGEGASAVALRLHDRDALAATAARLAARLGQGHEVLGWPRLLPTVAVSARFHDVTAWVVLAVFFGIVAAAVVNPVLMSVLERTREFGVLLALGLSQRRLIAMVLLEAGWLGLLGLLVGNLLGLAVTAFFARHGIDLSAFGSAVRTMPGLEDVTYPVIRAERSAMVSAVVFATACLAAVYPAVKAAGLEPVAAIRGLWSAARGTGHAARRARLQGPVFLTIAARNVWRNRRRTAVTVGGTAFGIAAFVFLFGYFDGFGEELVDNSTRYLTGHVQLERPGWRSDLAPELAFAGAPRLIAGLGAMPEVEAAAPRVQAQALASSPRRSEGIMLIGIDPEAERRVTFIDRTVVEGAALAPGADGDVLIGRELARRLELRVGEKLIVMSQSANGELGTHAYRVRGLFATESSAFDGTMAFVTLPAAQALLALEGRITNLNLRLRDRDAAADVLRALRSRVADPAGLAAVPWQELLPQVDEMIRLTRVLSDTVLAMAFLVIVTAIMNTVYMAVAERTRELGVMTALGTPPAAIRRLIVYETTALMVMASLIGYGVGAWLVWTFGRRGIDLSGFFRGFASIPGLTGVVHPRIDVGHIVPPGLVLFAASILVSLLPASRAARLDPMVAIRRG